MKKFTEELNDSQGGTKKNTLKISENVRNPSENVPKVFGLSSATFANFRKSLEVFG